MTPRVLDVSALWLVALLGVASTLAAQVEPTLTLKVGGITTTSIRNPSHEPLTVTVELRERHVQGGHVSVGREVAALVSPTSFWLAPGESQVVRVRLHEPVAPGTVLGVVVTFAPARADVPTPGSDTQAVARLVFQTRFVAKATVAP